MTKLWLVLLGAALSLTNPVAQSQPDARQRLIERAKSLELNTPYVPPPGDPMEHYASGYAKIMCSSVFITGLDPAFAAENVGYFTAPYAERAKLGTPKIDREKRTVQVTMPNGRRASLRDSGAGSQPDQDSAGRRCGLRPRGHDRGVRRHVQRADHRRALRREHHTHDAARGLVDGEEHKRNAYGHPHQTRRVRPI